jgi:hypothetical protein
MVDFAIIIVPTINLVILYLIINYLDVINWLI